MATQKIPGRAIELGDDTSGDVAYFDGSAWRRLPIGEAGEVLTMNTAGTFPEWGAPSCPWNQGVLRGYSSGGNDGGWTSVTRYTRIDNYSFVTDSDATDWGDLVRDNYHTAGTASATHGYVMGGEYHIGHWQSGYAAFVDTIQKFSFAANANATDVSDTTVVHDHGTGHSDGTYGYNCYNYGMTASPSQPAISPAVNAVDRFPFATDTNATDVGDMNVNQNQLGGISSCTHGYYSTDSGVPNGALAGNINRFAFASPATAADVGDMVVVANGPGGSMSETHGYLSGGHSTNQIQKFSFATLGNSTDVGDLLHTGHSPSTSSSTTHNYNAGGWMGEQNPSNQINKWSTANDANATDVGDLWAVNYGNVGAQV
jgi:hypothetical protein